MSRSMTFIRPLAAALTTASASLTTLLQAYAAILFLSSPLAGGCMLLATALFPNVAACGLIAALTARSFAYALNFNAKQSTFPMTNALLVGLSLGAAYQLNAYLLLLVILGSCLATLLSVILADYLWRLDRLPLLSTGFVFAAIATAFAGQTFHTLLRNLSFSVPTSLSYVPDSLNDLLIAMGSTLFLPHPLVGLILLLVLGFNSRYLLLLAIVGFSVGQSVYDWLTGSPYPSLANWIGFNFILSSLAIGGIFTLPSRLSFLLAVFAAALSALVTLSLQSMLLLYGLPVMALPFLITTLLILTALTKRPYSAQLQLLLYKPDLPENSLRQARLAHARGALLSSTPLYLPYFGSWDIYQGFDGDHTHKGLWRYAVDFYQLQHGKSFRNQGEQLSDYYCFGLPVLSPAAGYVVAVENSIADNAPGDVNVQHNWGNYLIIRLDNQQYMVLAHLQQYSVQVALGERIEAKQALARCGNSGRSPQPHLHLHLQYTPTLGSATIPFHFVECITEQATQRQYHAFWQPALHDRLTPMTPHKSLRQGFRWQVGQYMDVEYRNAADIPQRHRFTVKLSLEGEFQLHSDTGARISFYHSGSALHCYNRQGPSDAALDLWLLALDTVPFSNQPLQWHTQQDLSLLPFNWWQGALLHVLKPLGGLFHSYVQRHASNDPAQPFQSATHSVTLLPGLQWQCQTRSFFSAKTGCQHIECHTPTGLHRLLVMQTGLISDHGIPAIDDAPNPAYSGDSA